MDFMRGNKVQPVIKRLSEVDEDFVYSDDMVLFKFFFSIIPVVSFAAYFDDYKAVSSLSDEELRSSFLRASQIIAASMIAGSDILLRNNSVKV